MALVDADYAKVVNERVSAILQRHGVNPTAVARDWSLDVDQSTHVLTGRLLIPLNKDEVEYLFAPVSKEEG